MYITDKIREFVHFIKEARVLRHVDAEKVEYYEDTINGVVAEQDILIDGESVKKSLEAKKKYIEAYAQKERIRREKKVKKGEKKGQPLGADAIKVLRDAEERKRFEGFCHIRELQGR